MADKASNDPFPYDGPIRSVDGCRPLNGYLWPTEQWVYYNDHPKPHVDFDMRIEIVALGDGRFATCGWVRSIEQGKDFYGQKPAFATRTEAIRSSAARMIRLCRRIVRGNWDRIGVKANAPKIITWARHVVARETGQPEPRPIQFRMPAPPPPPIRLTGLPLFDAPLTAKQEPRP
jgi:hypothetical protein